MIASHRLLYEILKRYRGAELSRELSEKFLFFESRNELGDALFTGYYEPVVEGSLEPNEEFNMPVYSKPHDLVRIDLGEFNERMRGEWLYGRFEGEELMPYDSRADIMYRSSLKGRARPIAYVNEIELFFLQIQGSGMIRLADGTVKRVNYVAKNGHPYRSIGELLIDRIPSGKMSMQAVKEYLYAHPDQVREILSYNPSYVFFREVDEGPLGYIEVPLTPERSVAMDGRIIPEGGIAYIETKYPVFEDGTMTGWKPLRRFVLVQDTGDAIRGHGRVDIFWGNGEEAEMTAGHMKQRGRVFLVVAKKDFLPGQ
jgi:membrane-bound lytic murein transglycosylase A